MKKGWTYKKIKEVGEVIGGTTPSTSNPAYWGGDICWISPAELHGEHYLYDSVKKITKEAVAAKSLKQLPIGTVILSSRAPIGKIAINKIPMYCNQGFKCVVCGPELYNEYLYWWFYGKKDYLNSLGTGATFPEISKTVVENIAIPIPSLPEQQRIVKRLDAAFAHIDELKANAEKQLAEVQALFQRSLTEEMKPKEGWEEKKLGEVTSFQNGFAFKSNLFRSKGNPIVRISNIQNEEIDTKGIVYFNKKDYDVNFDGFRIFPNDILIAMSGGTTGKIGINKTDITFYQNQRVGVIREDVKKLNHRFLYYFLHTKSEESLKIAAGAAQPNLSTAQIKDFLIPLPPLPTQQRIVERLDALSTRVKELEEIQRKTIAECDTLKQAILREVFE